MMHNNDQTKKLIRQHICDKQFMAYKVYGYNKEKDSLCSAYYPIVIPKEIWYTGKEIVGPGWHISNRTFGFINTYYDNDFPIMMNGEKHFRVDKGIHIILNKKDTENHEIFPYCITVPVAVSPLCIVSVGDWGHLAIAMKVFITNKDYEKALSGVQKKIETFDINIERTKMRW